MRSSFFTCDMSHHVEGTNQNSHLPAALEQPAEITQFLFNIIMSIDYFGGQNRHSTDCMSTYPTKPKPNLRVH